MDTDIFHYPDTNSSRSKIELLNLKFNTLRVAIIGLGGTGSYILDLLSKTPVAEIHIYDDDYFFLHNAFRAPGAIDIEKLQVKGGLKKVRYYQEIYSHMHTRIIAHDCRVSESNLSDLIGFNYAFVCVDSNKSRKLLTSGLLRMGVTFIDVGLGVQSVNNTLLGTLRVTTATEKKNDHLKDRVGEEELDENAYATNIQIADLNCLNAAMAILKWKRMCGFYQDLKDEYNSFYFINTNKILNEDYPA